MPVLTSSQQVSKISSWQASLLAAGSEGFPIQPTALQEPPLAPRDGEIIKVRSDCLAVLGIWGKNDEVKEEVM